FFQQFAVTIAASTIISALNALTMTPSRALLILRSGGLSGGRERREALPWWIFGLVGGWLGFSFGPSLLAGPFGLPAPGGERSWTPFAAWFVLGALAGLALGWFVIRPVNAVLGWVFRGFDRLFEGLTGAYGWTLGKAMHLAGMALVFYAGLLVLTWWLFQSAPTGFVPQQDMGRCLAG